MEISDTMMGNEIESQKVALDTDERPAAATTIKAISETGPVELCETYGKGPGDDRAVDDIGRRGLHCHKTMTEQKEQILTLQDAFYLMQILENDIPSWEKSKIALLLMILSANPDLAKDGKEVVGYSPRSSHYYAGWDDAYGEW